MATGPTPTIEIVIRDEVSAAMERQRQKIRGQDQRATFQKTRQEIQLLEGAASRFQREIGTLLSMTGITAFFSGGLVAGIAKATQALGSMARESLNTQYTAKALGLTVEQFDKLKVRVMATGQTEQQAAGTVSSVAEALRELQTQGNKSSVWHALENAKGGKEFLRDLMATINGPGGLEVAFQKLATRMGGVNANALNLMTKAFNTGSAGFADIFKFKESELAKIVHMSEPETRKYALSMANLNITYENVKKTLALAVMPNLAEAMKQFDKLLQGPLGKIVKDFGTWLSSLKIDWDAIAKGVKTILDAISGFFDSMGKLIKELDPIVKQMGGWGKVLTTLGALLGAGMLGGWILRVTRGFAFVARQAPVIAALTVFATAMVGASSAGAFSGGGKGLPGGAAGVQGKPGSPSGPAVRGPGGGGGGGGGGVPTGPVPTPRADPRAPYGRDRRGRAYPAPGGGTTGYQPGVDDQEDLRASVKAARVQVAALGNYLSSLGLTTDASGAGPLAGFTGAISPGGGRSGGSSSGGSSGGSGPRSTPTGPRNVNEGETPARFASVRHNNPGAMYPGESARRFATTGTSIIGGGHKIATFPSPVHGAAANMDNLARLYNGLTVTQAVRKWSNGGRSTVPGFDSNLRITPELLNDPKFIIPFFQALVRGEAPGKYPMDQAQWEQAFRWYQNKGQPKGEDPLQRVDPKTGQPLAPGQQPVPGQNPPAPNQNPPPADPNVPAAVQQPGALPAPVTGVIQGQVGDPRGNYTGRRAGPHQGLDIFAPTGTPTYAQGNARVDRVYTSGSAAGNAVVLTLTDGPYKGYQVKYFHLDSFGTFRPGDTVKAGDVVGYVGRTGAGGRPLPGGTPSHLHYEVRDQQGRLVPNQVLGIDPRESRGRQITAGPVETPEQRVIKEEARRAKEKEDYESVFRKTQQDLEQQRIGEFSRKARAGRIKVNVNLRGPRGVTSSASGDGDVGAPTINREMDPSGGRIGHSPA